MVQEPYKCCENGKFRMSGASKSWRSFCLKGMFSDANKLQGTHYDQERNVQVMGTRYGRDGDVCSG